MIRPLMPFPSYAELLAGGGTHPDDFEPFYPERDHTGRRTGRYFDLAGELVPEDVFHELMQGDWASDAQVTSHSGETLGQKDGSLNKISPVSQRPEVPRPDLQELLDHPIVRERADRAWNESNPENPPNAREQAFYILRNPDGTISTVDSTGNNSSTEDEITSQWPPRGAIAFFHTHPIHVGHPLIKRPENMVGIGQSKGDDETGDKTKLPGIIRGTDGFHFYGAELHGRPPSHSPALEDSPNR